MTDKLNVKKLLILVVLVSSLIIISNPALASDDGPINLCDQAEDTSNTIQTVFTIFSVLGPVFGSLFFIGMTVADTAKMSGDYKKERKRVLMYGFSVPIAIQFLHVIGSQLVTTNISCFFPGTGSS